MKKVVPNQISRKNKTSDITDQRIKSTSLAIANDLQVANEYLSLTENRTYSFQLGFQSLVADINFIGKQWGNILTITCTSVTQTLITRFSKAVNSLTAFNFYLFSAYTSKSNFLINFPPRIILRRIVDSVTRVKNSFLFKFI